eukprot:6191729-Pleurochrysis_carterae.AAC.3
MGRFHLPRVTTSLSDFALRLSEPSSRVYEVELLVHHMVQEPIQITVVKLNVSAVADSKNRGSTDHTTAVKAQVTNCDDCAVQCFWHDNAQRHTSFHSTVHNRQPCFLYWWSLVGAKAILFLSEYYFLYLTGELIAVTSKKARHHCTHTWSYTEHARLLDAT